MAAAAIRSVSGGVQHQRPQAPAVLDLRVAEVRQLFDSMDPAPFRERDLDPKAAAYIIDWAGEMPKVQPLALVVHAGAGASAGAARDLAAARPAEHAGHPADSPASHPPASGDAALLGDAVHEYFRRRAAAKRRELSQLFRVGRISLVIGLGFLAAAIAAAEALSALLGKESHTSVLTESLIIGGWVALWRPMEIFLYDWWPIRGRARLYDRLAAMQVDIRGTGAALGAAQ